MLIAMLVSVGAFAQAQHTVLTAKLPVWDILAADVNGDGFKDILAYCSEDQAEVPTKELHIFLANTRGHFNPAQEIRHRLPPQNGTAFVSEFDGAPPAEIVLLEQSGADLLRLEGGELTHIERVTFVSILPTGSREPVFLRGAAHDVDTDGREDWLLPVPAGYGVFRGGVLAATLPAPTTSELRDYSNFQISSRLPDVSTFALPEEPLRAIALLSDTRADFAFGDGWATNVQYPIPRRLDEKWDSSASLEDVNGDGWPDLMVTQTSGTVNLKTETQIYIATGPFEYPGTPTARHESNGSFTSAALRDTNGDEKLDLVFINIPIGLGNIINYFIRKKVNVEAAVYEFGPRGFAAKPSRRASLTLDAPDGRQRSAYAMADFDGDGFLDACVGSAAETMSFFRGSSKEFLSASPWIKLEMNTFGVARTGDLDANGKHDLLLIHPSSTNSTRIDVVMF